LNRPEKSVHAVSVRQEGTWGWRWEVIDPGGLTVAQGTAWTYSDAIGRAWAAERAARNAARDQRLQSRRRPRLG
jgi:hypothetical protein